MRRQNGKYLLNVVLLGEKDQATSLIKNLVLEEVLDLLG